MADIKEVFADWRSIEEFATALKNYCNDMEESFNDIKNDHYSMSNYWQDEMYDACTDIIASTDKKVSRSIDDIRSLIVLVDKRAAEIQEAEAVMKSVLNGI